MRLLGFDASSKYASLGLMDRALIFEQSWQVGRMHSQELAPAIHSALSRLDGGLGSLDGIAVGTGPGSYTGIRIALAVAKGMAIASGVPLVGFSTLEILARACSVAEGTICAATSLGADRVAIGEFEGPPSHWRRLKPDRSTSIQSAAQAIPDGSLLCGPAPELDLNSSVRRAPCIFNVPRAGSLLELALTYLEAGGTDQTDTLQPNYLRRSTPEERLEQMERSSEVHS